MAEFHTLLGESPMRVVLELPFPPSTNSIWKPTHRQKSIKTIRGAIDKGAGIDIGKIDAAVSTAFRTSKAYEDWKKECKHIMHFVRGRPERGYFPTQDELEVSIVMDRRRRTVQWKNLTNRSDVDNRIKPILDALQEMNIYPNDSQVADVRCRWGDTGDADVVVTVSEIGAADDGRTITIRDLSKATVIPIAAAR